MPDEPALTLVVVRCKDPAATRRFYEALGLAFRFERHGDGPDHWSALIGGTVFEIYPAGRAEPSFGRLGLSVRDIDAAVRAAVEAGGRAEEGRRDGRAVVIDPDGMKVELSASTSDRAGGGLWSVWRQDDNGNRFRISTDHARGDAERLCAEFEARGHKQAYWIEPHERA